MKKIYYSFVLFFLLCTTLTAQERYHYVIVPKQFSFLKSPDAYRVNTLTKSFFESEGFTVYYREDKLPKELVNNNCNFLFIEAVDKSKLFATTVVIRVKDCQNNILLESNKGNSREKTYQKAYNQAFRKALQSLKGKTKLLKNNSNIVTTITQKTIKENKSIKTKKPMLTTIATVTGFKIINNNSKVVYLIKKTENPKVFIAQKGTINGVFIQHNKQWFFNYYQNNQLFSEKVSVVF